MPIEKRFWEKVEKHRKCWLWTGAIGHHYGQIQNNGTLCPAHRVSWILKYGEIPKGLQVLHRCDVPLCVRPSHLFLGTQSDNIRDAMKKGRYKVMVGSLNGKALFSESEITELRKLAQRGVSFQSLADKHKVHVKTIEKIVGRRSWKHI